ncbi:hypothetical protein SAICODRAFT_29783 [Saitoella complicata NRRL Y-17804]|uniref:FAD-binding domain-containing protein n=1 Tax=Saitoella complicata (strain BCRC 22490 / CBS 7301 / JCM 7358 / NBRC 10748 / NRRL Y-17804) TaxID=698492 RepID=A0A0E9NS38_SAICN|nr:uncharacterized protein SAICODRAFT_29783 [Saitoella complicata NRRL Y-17804]ODQ54290.1 hypothetical protein SAICODRAFT_29783 [Saitoella complicata NRRL Y-17804]GAO52250.1 hypothetical protein G7K_6331-t1 [Saitoella complicata NRRL Y-17804]
MGPLTHQLTPTSVPSTTTTNITGLSTPWPLNNTPTTSSHSRHSLHLPTALIKGAGPGGLAASITLARLGYLTLLIDKRPTHFRTNFVVLRPETLRQLSLLGALKILEEEGKIERIMDMEAEFPVPVEGSEGEITVESMRPPFVDWRQEGYDVPVVRDLGMQHSTHTVRIADLEHALLKVAHQQGVIILRESTVRLTRTTDRFRATLSRNGDGTNFDLGFPDLIVIASGKRDPEALHDIGITYLRHHRLTASSLPTLDQPNLLLPSHPGPLERQFFITFEVKSQTPPSGTVRLRLLPRRDGESGVLERQVESAHFAHQGSIIFGLQIPRVIEPTDECSIGHYVLGKANEILCSEYKSLEEMPIVWGSPTKPFVVEVCSARTFTYGSNLVLLGDAAGSSTLCTGQGAEIAATVDPLNLRDLAEGLKKRREAEAKGHGVETTKSQEELLAEYNVRKAETLLLWSETSDKFWLEKEEVEEIRRKTRVGRTRAARL